MQPHFSRGAHDSCAFVFSCPGKHEQRAGHPAAGKTGRNLELLLAVMSARLGHAALVRDCVTITNAWPQVEYEELTGRSEATTLEILEATNIARLAGELQHVSHLIVFCGEKARRAAAELAKLNLLAQEAKIAFVEHLGARGLLSIEQDLQGNRIVAAKEQKRLGRRIPLRKIQNENTHRRIAVVAQRLLDSMRRQGASEDSNEVQLRLHPPQGS